MSIVSNTFAILFFALAMVIFAILYRVMIMLAVCYDCKSKGVKDKSLWMVLTFLFPIIAGIIYACRCNSLEKTVPKLCTNCNTTVAPNVPFCPVCQSSMFIDYQIPDKDKHIKTRKISLTVGIISAVMVVVCYFAMLCSSVQMLGGWDALEDGDFTEFYDKLDDFEDAFDDDYFTDDFSINDFEFNNDHHSE